MAKVEWDACPARMRDERACLHPLSKQATGSGTRLRTGEEGCARDCGSLRVVGALDLDVTAGPCDDPSVFMPNGRIEVPQFYMAFAGPSVERARGVHAWTIDLIGPTGIARVAHGWMKGVTNFGFGGDRDGDA